MLDALQSCIAPPCCIAGWVQLRQPRPREVKAKFARLPPHILEEMERRHDEWLETKRFFLQGVQDLQLPFNPLDEIIDGLGGPNAVAEMTGRKVGCKLVLGLRTACACRHY